MQERLAGQFIPVELMPGAGAPVKTLRDEMAMAAMAVWIKAMTDGTVDDLNPKIIAIEAYKQADAMLATRQKGGAV